MNRKKNTSQLLDSILNEKNLTVRNLIIGVAIISIVGLIGIRLSFSHEEHAHIEGEKDFDTNYQTALLEEIGFSKMEIEEMDESLYSSFADRLVTKTRNQVAGENYKKELSYSDSRDVKMDFYQHATNNDFEHIIDRFSEIKSQNFLSQPWNQSLIKIYYDAYTIKSVLSNNNNLSAQISALNNINDERMLLTAFLNSSIKARNSVLKDRLSLTPSKDDNNLRINSVMSSTASYFALNESYKQDAHFAKMFEYLHEGDFILYKINFDLSEHSFSAYMFKNLETLKLEMFGVYTDDSNTRSKYVTVIESEEIESNIYKYNQSMK